jgi:alkaline phosphatase D
MGATFEHGVAAGDPTIDGAVIQTAVSGVEGDIEVAWEIDDVANPAVMVAEGTAMATAAADHTVSVTVTGLEPGHQYRYRFVADGVTSPGGRFKTLPAEPDHLRFAVVCCAKFNSGFFNVYGRVAERSDLDFVFHAGDYIYEASQTPPASQTPGADIGRPMDPVEECKTLDQYRTRYRQYRQDPDLMALHRAHALMNTIDDHELADNAWSGGSQEHFEDRDGPWAERKRQALQAWHEWVPSRVDPNAGDTIYRSIDLGRLARLVVLETRTTRSAPGEDRLQMGPEQEAWYASEMTREPKPEWVLLGMASAPSRFWREGLSDLATEALRKLKLVEPDGSGHAVDRWDGFESERDRMLDVLAKVDTGRLVLSGDVHCAIDQELKTDDGRFAGVSATSSSCTSANMDDKMGWGVGESRAKGYEAAIVADLPDIRWIDIDYHGYLVVDLDADHAIVEWWGVDDVLAPNTGERLLHKIRINNDGHSEVLETDA